jgi:peptidoglycan hydrolase-like protein with peptidoglycan-binding domain
MRVTLAAALAVLAVTAASACVHRDGRDEPRRSAAASEQRADAAVEGPELTEEQVELVQGDLQSAGIPVEVTGVWDAQTEAGLIQFQERHGFTPTGRLDADTRRELSLDPPPMTDAPERPVTRAPDEDRLRLAPPPHVDPQGGAAENVPQARRSTAAGAASVVTPPERPNRIQDAGAFQACVDRELSRRGLNAYGDPPGTPPRDADDRYEFVMQRYPDIGTVCTTTPW